MSHERSRILPGSTIGVLGSGQLGRMLALAARTLGYRVHVFSPEQDTPAGQVADVETVRRYEDLEAVREFAGGVDVVTFEFENIPVASTHAAAECAPVRPAGEVLHVAQNRLREKTFLAKEGFPVTPFCRVQTMDDLRAGFARLGPGILKTADFGYDGKGQARIAEANGIESAWKALGGAEAIYEAYAAFEKELSVVAARTVEGDFAAFPIFENRHSKHILDVTFAPAQVEDGVAARAVELARGILAALEVVGVLTVELFLLGNGELLVNELAPRTHNSGHLTIDACVTGQFEQQVRAVCLLPLGSAELRQPAAMANLLGEIWSGGEPDWAAALEDPEIKLHLYGKSEARPGRKMGHLTCVAESTAEAVERVLRARERLRR